MNAFNPLDANHLPEFAAWRAAKDHHDSLNHADGSRNITARLNHRAAFERAWNALRLAWLRDQSRTNELDLHAWESEGGLVAA